MKFVLKNQQFKATDSNNLDPNGFLRKKVRFAKMGVMSYGLHELVGQFPQFDEIFKKISEKNNGKIRVLGDEGALFDSVSIDSLGGMPVIINHHWIDPTEPDSKMVVIGSVAGQPKRDGDFLIGEILITDQQAIEKIIKKDVIELSPAYTFGVEIRSGEWNGAPYDAVKKNINYNHIALLPYDEGRNGNDVKIIDKKQEVRTMSLVRTSTPFGFIESTEEGAGVIANIIKTLDGKIKNIKEFQQVPRKISQVLESIGNIRAADKGLSETERSAILDGCGWVKKKTKATDAENVSLDETLAMLNEINTQIEELSGKRDEYLGQIEGLKKKIEEVMAPENLEAIAAERKEIEEVGQDVTGQELPENIKKMSNDQIKEEVVKKYLGEDSVAKLWDSKKSPTPEFINGVWMSLRQDYQTRKKTSSRGTVPTAGAAQDSWGQQTKKSTTYSDAQRLGFRVPQKES